MGSIISSSVDSCGAMPNCSVIPSPLSSLSVASSLISKVSFSCWTLIVCPARNEISELPPLEITLCTNVRSCARCAAVGVRGATMLAILVRLMVSGLN